MNTAEAMERNVAAIKRGTASRVFDWRKAANLLVEKMKEGDPFIAYAGLEEDMEWTGGTILSFDGHSFELNRDSYTYLASNWAKPILVIHYEDQSDLELCCWEYSEDSEYDSSTRWPTEAVNILADYKDSL